MLQIQNPLRLQNDSDVRYLMIGATAFAAHGWVRATADVDLFIDDDRANVERLRAADLPLDLHPFVEGAASFDECWARRKMADIGGVVASFIALDDLIEMKRAAGRPKDREDLRQLERLRDLQDE